MKDVFKGNRSVLIYPEEYNNVFRKPVPVLPDAVSRVGITNYPVMISNTLSYAMEQYLAHLLRIAGDEDYRQREGFKWVRRNSGDISPHVEFNYKKELSETLFNVMKNDDRGEYLNLFFLVLGVRFSQFVSKYFRGDFIRFTLNSIVYDLHRKVLSDVFNRFEDKYPYVFKKNFMNMNMELVEHIIRDQLALFDVPQGCSPGEVLESGNGKLTNSRFLISRETFGVIEENSRRILSEVQKNARYTSLMARTGLVEAVKRERPLANLKLLKLILNNEKLVLSLSKNSTIRGEQEKLKISLQEILYLYYDVVLSFKRHRLLWNNRKLVVLDEGKRSPEQLKSEFSSGTLFRFGADSGVYNRVKDMSVLFLDIRNFSLRSKYLGPQETVKQLSAIFDPTPEIIGGQGGSIDKLMGDGLMALFPPGEGGASTPVKALRAAVLLYEHFGAIQKKVDFEDVGIGIATGQVMMAQLGNYTSIGETVNLSSRLSSSKTALDFGTGGNIEIVRGPTYKIDENVRLINDKKTGGGLNSKVFINNKSELYNTGIALDGATFDDIKKNCDIKIMKLKSEYIYVYYDQIIKRNIMFRLAGRADLKGVGKVRVFEAIWDKESVVYLKDKGHKPGIDEISRWLSGTGEDEL